MAGGNLSPRNDKISVKHGRHAFDGAFFQLVDSDRTGITSSENEKSTVRNSDLQSSEVLSTTDIISAVSYAWGRARQPLSVLLSKNNSPRKTEVLQEGDVLHYFTDRGTFHVSTPVNNQSRSGYLNSKNSRISVTSNPEDSKEISCPQPSYEWFSFWRILQAKCLSSTDIPSAFGSTYGWMSEFSFPNPQKQVNTEIGHRTTIKCCSANCSKNSTSDCTPADTPSSGNNLTSGISAPKPEAQQSADISSGEASNSALKGFSTTCSENNIMHVENMETSDNHIFPSVFDTDTNLASPGPECEISKRGTDHALYEHQNDQGLAVIEANSSEVKISSFAKKNPQYALAKQEHAFAGAMAGIFVSLCLHPMDTVKTVVQSCCADQKTLHNIGRSIISERGISGLYRGISSNILTSAPISAVYTFTYESVKKSLLPLLPKEYHSLSHCMAGGCASVATSFIFTPSERIKQQMQVGSRYRNSWNALIEVVQRGGFSSLYAGWGAVLCRNVPHSIIKFYTYESLKQIMLPSVQSDAQANTFVTLVCGGLAGSTASLFTTPFDVVKTRLQTQVPGSMTQYTGVIKTLREIAEHEGLNGLYRGLTPRLVMYMIQGALFFASYESFKSLLSLNVHRQLSSQKTRYELEIDDDSALLPSLVSVSA